MWLWFIPGALVLLVVVFIAGSVYGTSLATKLHREEEKLKKSVSDARNRFP